MFIVTCLISCNISGTVRDENGTGLEGVIVYLISTDDIRTDITDQEGDFSFTHVKSGSFTIRPGNFGQSEPELYEIKKGAADVKKLTFTLNNVTRIGLTYNTGQALTLLMGIDSGSNIRKAILENKGVVVTFSTFDTESLLNEKLKTIDGLILPGGIDVDPSSYGEAPHENLETTEKAFDLLEFDVLGYAENHQLPVFGICRGVQVINVFYGGSLYQDIPSQVQEQPVVIHRTNDGTCVHDIFIYPETGLSEILGTGDIVVNSSHHQAIKDLADGFTISAVSPDGLIEAIEKTGPHLVMGLQFHPEILRKTKPEFNRLFEAFMAEVKNTQQAGVH